MHYRRQPAGLPDVQHHHRGASRYRLNFMTSDDKDSTTSRLPNELSARLELRHLPHHCFQLRLINANSSPHPKRRSIEPFDPTYRWSPFRPTFNVYQNGPNSIGRTFNFSTYTDFHECTDYVFTVGRACSRVWPN